MPFDAGLYRVALYVARPSAENNQAEVLQMIETISNCECTGCGACADVCPVGAITMSEDADGFVRPNVDKSKCFSCGLCDKTCPVGDAGCAALPRNRLWDARFFAGQLKDCNELQYVSSGGAFWALVRAALDSNGVVYGAVQENVDEIRHARAETNEEALSFRRSKYLQSSTAGQYRAAKRDLESGRFVLFSGTGCQVAGLLAFLGKPYDNLITCEVVCHGVPSRKAWRQFRKETEERRGSAFREVVFRDKSAGWSHNQYSIAFEDGMVEKDRSDGHVFHSAYLHGFISRKACSHCRFASMPRVADITLADFWKYEGVLKGRNGDVGVSLIMPNNNKGQDFLAKAGKYVDLEEVPAGMAVASCRHMHKQPLENPQRDAFLESVWANGYYATAQKFGLAPAAKPSLARRIYRKMRLIKNRLVRRIAARRNERAKFLIMKDALLLCAQKGVPVYFYNRVGREKSAGWRYAESAERRMALGLDFPTMYTDRDKYRDDLMEVFADRYSDEYVDAIGKIPQVVKVGDMFCHEDCKGEYVNVVGGRRVTCGQPLHFTRTIHVYGRCGAFGYAVEDKDTLPSQMQKLLVERGLSDVRVENHGLWGGDDNCIDSNFLHDAMGFKDGDIVLFYRMHLDKRLHALYGEFGMRYKEITHQWHAAPSAKWCFFNQPGHMNHIGYANAAAIIVDDLLATGLSCLPVSRSLTNGFNPRHLTRFLKENKDGEFVAEMDKYIRSVKEQAGGVADNSSNGAIVMNCNPFTLGHRHLVEYAAKRVDTLFVFVVEEDRSFFKFADRLEMVRRGIEGIGNVVVVPSGKFIISALTFPEYFMKDYVKEKNFDVSSDVRTFCQHIAPPLGIRTRFVGEEPTDPVTATYNRRMHELLPRFGMTLCEIPRLGTADGRIVSATEVRRLLSSGDLPRIKALVPASTYQVIKERYCGAVNQTME